MPIEALDERTERFFFELGPEEVPAIDPIFMEIVKNRMFAMANEMGVALHRTAHTPIFAETKGFACAVFDHSARMIGMGDFLPGHQGAMQTTLEILRRSLEPEGMVPGDVYMVNDSMYTGGKVPDVSLYSAVELGGELVGYVGCIVHHIDMGGIAPSSISPKATEIYQEGIRFPPGTRLVEGGELRKDILGIFLTNVRLPEAQRGDLMAQVNAVQVGRHRLEEIARRHGVARLRDAFTAIQHYARRAVEALLQSWPDCEHEADDWVDGDGQSDRLFRVHCRMTKKDGRVTFDFRGTDEQAPGFINCHWGNTAAHSYSALMAMLPDCPKVFGAMVPMDLLAEKGSLINAGPRAAIGASSTESGHLIHNVVWYLLSQATPELGSGVWAGAWAFQFLWGTDPRTGRYFICLLQSAGGGGGGARRDLDGWTNACQKCSNVTMPNIEIEEQYWPILYLSRGQCAERDFPGTGAGRSRGGLGIAYEVSPRGTDLQLTSLTTKYTTEVHGVFGGRGGHPAHGEIRDRATGTAKEVLGPKVQGRALAADESIAWAMTGGGGYGDQLERDPQKVLVDIIDEYVTLESARDVYGVVIDPERWEVDVAATAALRAERAAEAAG
jgi:N-methylhydantoinase B